MEDYLIKNVLVNKDTLQSSDVLEIVVSPSQLEHIAEMSGSDGWDRFNGGPSINQMLSLAKGLGDPASSFRVVLSKDHDAGWSMEVRDFLVGVNITKAGEVRSILEVFTENALERPQMYHTYRSGNTFLVFASWEEQ